MNRQQFALVVALGLFAFSPPFTAGGTAKASDWKSAADENGGSTLSGVLYRNSADTSGSAPYVLVDKWGVTRGYVAADAGVDLESSLGHQVTLQGTIRTLPGGDMPCMKGARIAGDNRETAPAAARGRAVPLQEVVLEPQPESLRDGDQNQPPPAPARRADPRRARYAGERTAYQEPIPAPPPGPSAHYVHGAPDPAADPGPAMERGPAVSQGPMVMDGGMMEGPMMQGPATGGCGCASGCDASCDASCDSCGPSACNNNADPPAWAPHRPLFLVGPTGVWARAEYLLWTESGMKVPALVTTGSDADPNPGALGEPGTSILYGNGTINDESRSGFRLTAGMWLNRCCTFGFEGEFITLADEQSNFDMWSDGNPILARPFTNTSLSPAQQYAELVAYPRNGPSLANSPFPGLDGSIDVNAMTRFNGAGARFLYVLCRQDGCWSDDCSCLSFHDYYRATFTAGYRYLDLEDNLDINERLTTNQGILINPTNSSVETGTQAFAVTDAFGTRNWFNGGEVGMRFELQRNRWGLELFPRIAIGDTHSTVTIGGQTITTDITGAETTRAGGLLAQPTNIGQYVRDDFSVVPEFDLTMSYQVTPHAKIVLGYSFLYWTNVARAGEQIDTNVDAASVPNSPVYMQPTGATHPQFTFVETGFWAQGLNVGLDCRW